MVLGCKVSAFALMAVPLWAGVQLNACNLVLTLLQLWKARTLSPASTIICSISFSNVVLGVSSFSVMLLVLMKATVVGPGQAVNPLFSGALFFWMSSCFVSFWSIAWLNVLYCVKVVSFSWRCLEALKRSISSLTRAALLLTLLGSCLLFSPFLTIRRVAIQPNATDGTNATDGMNTTSQSPMLNFAPWVNTPLYTTLFMCLLCPLPLAVMLPPSLRLVLHLCGHTLALRRNQTQCRGSASYLLVCRLTVSLVGVYVATLAIVSFFFMAKLHGPQAPPYELVMLGCAFYCAATAGVVTASNRHLKDALRCGGCPRDPSDPSGPGSRGHTRDTVLA